MSCGTKCDNGDKLFKSLQKCVDSVLSIPDCIGAVQHKTFIMTRTWSGKRPGEGTARESFERIQPSPSIVDYGHSLALKEGGAIKQGDIMLKDISKHAYPEEKSLDCSTTARNIEKYYYINDRQYTVIYIKENPLTWDIQLRKRSDETRRGE